MLSNLDEVDEDIRRRKEVAASYRQNLKNVRHLILPPESDDVLSHFTIRVPAQQRDEIISRLKSAGIEVGRLFFFSTQMREYKCFFPPCSLHARYPNASRLTLEVMNLPMHIHMTKTDVDWISENLAESVERTLNSPGHGT